MSSEDHKQYHRIVKFFRTEENQFFHQHSMEDVRVSGDMHVVKFGNQKVGGPGRVENKGYYNYDVMEVEVVMEVVMGMGMGM